MQTSSGSCVGAERPSPSAGENAASRPRSASLRRYAAALGLGLCLVGQTPSGADDAKQGLSALERLLVGTQRVATVGEVPEAFSVAIRAEYEASRELASETAFEPYLANRYFWTMESMERLTGRYAVPQPAPAAAKPMCSNGACDAPLDPTVWTGAWTGGSAPNITNGNLPIASWTSGLLPNNNSIPDQACPSHPLQAHHSIVPAGWDPEFPTQLRTVAPTPTLNPAALRLGNRCVSYGGERVAKTFPVVAGQTILQFWYAMVLQNPPGHSPAIQPGFGAYLYNGATPVVNRIDLDPVAPGPQELVYADATNPFFGSKGSGSSVVVYSAWTCVTVDLAGLEGQTLTLILVNRDCGASGHWGYTYVDSFCLGCLGGASGGAAYSPTKSDCVAGQLCFDYTVPTSTSGAQGQVALSLALYQGGVLVPPVLTSGPLTVNGTHCFTVPVSSLNAALGGYDWVGTASFTLGSTVIAPMQLGSAPGGQPQTPGLNDDCRFPPVDPCATLIREGRADPCCGYHLVLAPPAGWGVAQIAYVTDTSFPVATVTGITSTPMPNATSPPSPSGSTSGLASTTQGVLAYTPPVAGAYAFDVAAITTHPAGHVCLTLTVTLVSSTSGAKRECRIPICFDCCRTVLPRCDEITWEPCTCCPISYSQRKFTIQNTKVPASPICRIDIAYSPAPNPPPIGYAISIDGATSVPSWNSSNSAGYTSMNLGLPNNLHGPSAASGVQFMLGIDYSVGWVGSVKITVTHCDRTTCVTTFPWTAVAPGTLPTAQRTLPVAEIASLRVYRVAFPRQARRIRWIRLVHDESVDSIVAITGASMPAGENGQPYGPLESVKVNGRMGLLRLREGWDLGPRVGEPSVTVVYSTRSGRRPTVGVLYFDEDVQEVAQSTFQAEGVPLAAQPTPPPDRAPELPRPGPGPSSPSDPVPEVKPGAGRLVEFGVAGASGPGRGTLRRLLLVSRGQVIDLLSTPAVMVGEQPRRLDQIEALQLRWDDAPAGRQPRAAWKLPADANLYPGPVLQQLLVTIETDTGPYVFEWPQDRAAPGRRAGRELAWVRFLPQGRDGGENPPPAPVAPAPNAPDRAGVVRVEGARLEPFVGVLALLRVSASDGSTLVVRPGVAFSVGERTFTLSEAAAFAFRWDAGGPRAAPAPSLLVETTSAGRFAWPERPGATIVAIELHGQSERGLRTLFTWKAGQRDSPAAAQLGRVEVVAAR